MLPLAAVTAPKTVCTVTVNSADEKEAFRRRLPPGEYRFVELVEKGRPDWLASACRTGVQCDVLIVSGHFNAGETFYSDDLARSDSLSIDELERASCSDSCPGVFAQLKEVYLFGCESLNPDASKYASAHGESGRARMRRIFADVPVIYGFSSAAPLGAAAAATIERHFDASPRTIGTGRASAGFLRAFSSNHMVATQGVRDGEPDSAYRDQVCGFFDERVTPAGKLAWVHAMMARDMVQASGFFERIEGMLAATSEADRGAPEFLLALAQASADDTVRESFLSTMRATRAAGLRSRMIAVATILGWLDSTQRTAELVLMMDDMLAGATIGFPEVELACSLDIGTHTYRPPVAAPLRHPASAARTAVLACLGNEEARTRTVASLASADDRDVQAAQAYLRHRPVSDAAELRALARAISLMAGTSAQVRALDALGRHAIVDREIVEGLMRSFTATRSLAVQRAIAEIFLRSDPRAFARGDVADVLARTRIRSTSGDDLIDAVVRRLQTANAVPSVPGVTS